MRTLQPVACSGSTCRFNLGCLLWARWFGEAAQRRKKALVLDRESYRYHAFMSDIAGQGIHVHGGDVATLIGVIATWLREEVQDSRVRAGRAITEKYHRFQTKVPDISAVVQSEPEEIKIDKFGVLAAEWIVSDNDDHGPGHS